MWEAYQGCCLQVMTGSSVLDVGCGPGEQRAEAVDLWRARQYAGVDLSYGMVRDAHRLWSDSLFLAASAQGLPLRDRSFDVVTSSFLFHHIPPSDRLTALREQLRVGKFVLLRDLHAIELGITAWFYGAYSSVFDGSERRFTAPEWREFLAAAGAEILAEGYANTDHVLGRHCFFLLRQAQPNA
jgi:SAM-dependent methyltransferase